MVEYYTILLYLHKVCDYVIDKNEWFLALPNFGFLEERICDANQEFIVVYDNSNISLNTVIVEVLKEYGHNVFFINDDEKVDAVLKEIVDKHLVRGYAVIYAKNGLMSKLYEAPLIKKNIDVLCNVRNNMTQMISFGWLGDYVDYLCDIYNEDVWELIGLEDECDFSIVIPVRNSVSSLKYTLMTCLRQDYEGRYEILVSDNSVAGSRGVKDICDELNNERIRYIKTPRELQLTKSFEYACIHARGNFILSIGADDGLLSWSLSRIKEIMSCKPNHEVLQWNRGFYAWPGFNYGQENELIVLDKNKRNVYEKPAIDYIAEIFNSTSNIYGMPLLYINSGFKRDYLKTILIKTGRLWAGCNQDIYMGLVNIAINASILKTDEVITIAGMSSSSIGYMSVMEQSDLDEKKDEFEKHDNSNVAINCINGIEKYIPAGKGDICSLYWNLLRLIHMDVLPANWLTGLINWKKVFTEFFEANTIEDLCFDKYIHEAKRAAEKLGEDFSKWFVEEIYKEKICPQYIMGDKNVQKTYNQVYTEGMTKEGNYIYDAKKYGVANVFDAAVFYEKCCQ